jgi:hypothetical protein
MPSPATRRSEEGVFTVRCWTPPLRRLFAVLWWLINLGSLAAAPSVITANWLDFTFWFYWIEWSIRSLLWGPEPNDPNSGVVAWEALVWEAKLASGLFACLLPYIVLTITRWVVTGRWRLGPRW